MIRVHSFEITSPVQLDLAEFPPPRTRNFPRLYPNAVLIFLLVFFQTSQINGVIYFDPLT